MFNSIRNWILGAQRTSCGEAGPPKLPTVSLLLSLDSYRDGGSISASFKDGHGVQRTLFFGIDLISRRQSQFEVRGYLSPVLEVYTLTQDVIRQTEVTTPNWTKSSTPISWREAELLLSQMAPMVDELISDYKWVHAEMRRVAAANGSEPEIITEVNSIQPST